MRTRLALAAVILAAAAFAAPARAQFAGPGDPSTFRDTSMLKPPAGQKVAIIVFEDLECPACAGAHPIVQQAANQYHVPIVRYDFPLNMHVWAKDGAIFARYIQDKVNPALADEYRNAVFKQQSALSSREDLSNFNRRFMQSHGQQMPFVVDPQGALAAKIKADVNLGERLNVTRTPTIVVATTNRWQIVSGSESGSNDNNRIFPIVSGALAQSAAAPTATAAKTTPRKK